jgi:hypothetical protein
VEVQKCSYAGGVLRVEIARLIEKWTEHHAKEGVLQTVKLYNCTYNCVCIYSAAWLCSALWWVV